MILIILLLIRAHIAGAVGRELKALTIQKFSVPRIFALDPDRNFDETHFTLFLIHSIPGEGYEGPVKIAEPVSRFDGDYVQIIHSNGGELGMLNSAGSADFYPNGGSDHPGCDFNALGAKLEYIKKVCNHARSWQFYQESVRDPKAFPAIRCTTYDGFLKNDDGDDCNRTVINYLGFGADPRLVLSIVPNNTRTTFKLYSLRSRYYLETNGNVFRLPRKMLGINHMIANITDLPIKEKI